MLYSFFISIDRRKNSWKPVELHKIGEEFSGCETTISPVSVFLSLPLELFASLSLIFQYGGRPHSPNLHHISSSRSRTNFLIYTWKSALESRIIGSLFAFSKPALPLNVLSMILSLYYDSLLFFLFFSLFSIFQYTTNAIRTCVSIHGFITEKQRYEVGIQMNWSGDSGEDGWWELSKTEFQHAPVADICALYTIVLDAVQSWMRSERCTL